MEEQEATLGPDALEAFEGLRDGLAPPDRPLGLGQAAIDLGETVRAIRDDIEARIQLLLIELAPTTAEATF